MTKKTITVDDIDQLLPQTQCGLCDYKGCRPYATAIIEKNERIDRCPPGDVETLIALADLLNQDATPFISEMKEKAKSPSVAVIHEHECIGCTKCIQACPTDAIIGAGKLMHTVISDACTGCELCIEPCPVDCIDMVAIKHTNPKEKANQWRQRYQARNQRLENNKKNARKKHAAAKLNQSPQHTLAARKKAIEAAVARARLKKLSK